MSKRWYLLKKLLQSGVTVFLVLIMNFFLFRIMPGNPLRILIRNPRASQETLARINEQFGLDRDLPTQFLFFLRDLFRGDLGVSFNYRQPVLDVIMERVPATLLLVGVATVLSIILGVLIGVISAWKRGSKADIAGLSISLVFYSMPSFWFSILMIMLFAVYFKAFPTGGMGVAGAVHPNLWAELTEKARFLFLPATTFGLILAGEYALIMRNSLIEVLSEDYITTARAKGIANRDILRKHAIPNAMLPMVTLIAINLGFVIAGAIQVEAVFSWPGLGRLMYNALLTRDYPLLQGLFLIITICVIGANFCADILYGYLDPRVKS